VIGYFNLVLTVSEFRTKCFMQYFLFCAIYC